MKKIITLFIASCFALTAFCQNVGIDVTDPQQKLHVGGNVRIDGLASPANGIVTTNATGDMLKLNFTGNNNDVLKGDGSFGTPASGSLPTGAIVGSSDPENNNLLNAGFSFYGEMPNNYANYIQRAGGLSNQYDELPIYEKGNPAANPAPLPRTVFCSTWSGSEMMIWGGASFSNYVFDVLSNGKKYNPATDTWTNISNVNAPRKRAGGSTVWTGTEMIVWGGYDSISLINPVGYYYTNTGGRYNPATDSWTSTTQVGAPTARNGAAALWTGTYMMIWGGERDTGILHTGSRYNPATNGWLPMSGAGAPLSAGAKSKLFWYAVGGFAIALGKDNTGGRYNPTTNTWTPMANCPVNYDKESAVWNGSQVIVYSRQNHTIYKYFPGSNTWTSVVAGGSYMSEDAEILNAVWTGFEIAYFAFGKDAQWNVTDNRIYRYNVGTNSFESYSIIYHNEYITGGHTFLVAGSMILKWGGSIDRPDQSRMSSQGFRYYLNDGIAYPAFYFKNKVNNILYLYKKD